MESLVLVGASSMSSSQPTGGAVLHQFCVGGAPAGVRPPSLGVRDNHFGDEELGSCLVVCERAPGGLTECMGWNLDLRIRHPLDSSMLRPLSQNQPAIRPTKLKRPDLLLDNYHTHT